MCSTAVFRKRFLTGEVVLADRVGECAEGVAVTLADKEQSRTTKTDNYGDFEFYGVAHPPHVYTPGVPSGLRIERDRCQHPERQQSGRNSAGARSQVIASYDASGFVTGQTLFVDGGTTAS